MRAALLQGAPGISRRPFLLSLACLLGLALLPGGTPRAACAPDRIERSATVSYVADGDTVRLEDGEWVRLIGINTPEVGHDGNPDEPLARRAREALQQALAGSGMRVGLRVGSEPRDRHGRLLAHLFLADGSHLGERLLQQGLGFYIAIPPNLWAMDCLQVAEQGARQAGLGVWSNAWFVPLDSRGIASTRQGFMRVRGRVVRIGHSKKSTWLNLEGGVALRVPNRELGFFNGRDLDALRGKTVTARGWFYRHRGELQTTLHHPAMLETGW